jgi:outer membrane lipopolysaccharide assembly protein LptE/RlpB
VFSLVLCLCGLLLSGCGYRVAGTGANLPAEIRSIAVPALANKTARYRVEQRLTEAVIREFLARTKYRIVSDPAAADAVLRGEIIALESSAILFDNATGRATTMVVTVRLAVRLEQPAAGKTLWRNDQYVFREQYEISTDLASFFEEQEPALERLARDFAASLVSAVLERF